MKYYTLALLLLLLVTLSSQRVSNRIVGGNTANTGQFPFAAAITVETSNSRIFCGGTLLSNEWILTAGQCVDQATLFTIQLGALSLNGDEENKRVVATSEYVLHPEYDPMTLTNDIGLIKLRMPIEFNRHLNKIHLLGSSYVASGTLMMAIGWGQTSDDHAGFSDHLQWVLVSALSYEECRLTYGNQITNNTLCAEGNYNEGSCYGDTGSAVIQSTGLGHYIHVGIASFISANGCESTDPSGFIRTAPYRDWVRNVTGLTTI